MPKVLVVLAHPRLEKSRANRALLQRFPQHKDITLHDLYERYPDFNVDIPEEQRLLEMHDLVVLHHPIFWYSVPPLLKQWIDMVYAFGWAYGPGGVALKGRTCFHVVTTGGNAQAYTVDGFHGHTLNEFMLPLKRTATLCGMQWLPPFAVQGTNRMGNAELERMADAYSRMLTGFADGTITAQQVHGQGLLNEVVINMPMP
ncbi:MAG: NAD(P)H-dependent oxidoreductase [Flavobacteriales bacterium]|nr:NAD(P)H-dependent oxidoreductase [Flavobacteriales bacterium]